MDTRRYDRNADLLSQVFWHMNKISTHGWDILDKELLDNYLRLLEQALTLNDVFAKKTEMGLI